MRPRSLGFGVFMLVLTAGGPTAAQVPPAIHQEGLIVDRNGVPVEGPVDLRFELFAAAEGGAPRWSEDHPRVPLTEGYYSVLLGQRSPLTADVIRGAGWLQVSVDGDALSPRTRLVSVPFALVAGSVDGGPVRASTVAIGDRIVIDAQGRWVGDPTGLRGPVGPEGPPGPPGPPGPAGGNADPADVVPLVVGQLRNDPDALPYVRNDRAATKRGALVMDGAGIEFRPAGAGRAALSLNDNAIEGAAAVRFHDPGPGEGIAWRGTQAQIHVSPLDGGDGDGYLRLTNDDGIRLESHVRVSRNLLMEPGASISLSDRPVVGVGDPGLVFADPGPDGAVTWRGTQASIYVAPLDGSNADGYLRLANDAGISLESDVRTTGKLVVGGRLGVGTAEPASRVEIRDDSAPETGLTIRNQRPNTRTRPFVRLVGLTPRSQGTYGMMQLLSGEDAGGSDARNEGGLAFVVSTGGAGAPRRVMTLRHDGYVGLGTDRPLGRLHVDGADSRRNPLVVSSVSPGIYFFDTETLGGQLRYDSFAVEVDGSRFYIGSRSREDAPTPGSGSRAFTLSSDGNVGLGERSPQERLVVRGNAVIDGDLTITGRLLGAAIPGGAAGGAPVNGLRVAIPFTEGRGDTAADVSGAGNDMTLANGARWTQGVTDHAVLLDGVDDYVHRPNTGWRGYLTLSLWVKTASSSGYWVSESNPGEDGCWRYFAGFDQGRPWFRFWDNSNAPADRFVIARSRVTDDRWHHLAVTISQDERRLRLYVDGVEEANIETRGADGAYARLWVGGVHGGCLGDHVMSGAVDDFRLYHRALGAAEIRALYEAGSLQRPIYVAPDGNVGIGTTDPVARLHVSGTLRAETVNAETLQSARTDLSTLTTVAVGRVMANQQQTREREIANFTVNDHHWSLSNGFFVEAYSRYFDSGYVRYYVEAGYRSKQVRRIESRGDLAAYFGLRLVEDRVVGQRGGFPERRYRLYAQAAHYTQWNVFIRTASMSVRRGDVAQDGLLGVSPDSGHRDVDRLSNNHVHNGFEGDVTITGNVAVGGKLRHNRSAMNAARAICYSALAGNHNHSLIMIPLPNQHADLDAVCHQRINDGWHAGGVAKGHYFDQDCPTELDNDSYGGGYTSYVEERFFESNRGNYPNCGPTNAFICCSPQFPN